MRGLTELVPLAIGVAVIAGITWFLLDRNIGIGRWMLAALLFAHGWVHVMFLFPQPEAATATAGGLAYPFEMGRSWLIGAGLDEGLVRALGVSLIAVVMIGFLMAALSSVGLLVPESWWSGLVLASAAASTLLLGIFFAPALLIGLAINVALWWLVLASVWTPVAAGGRPLS